MTLNYLTTQNTYCSPNRRVHWFARISPTLVFYAKISTLVLNASRLCSKTGGADPTGTMQVEIAETAKISGTVTGEAIAVAEGAVVEGVMKTTTQNEPTTFVEKRGNDEDVGDDE